MLPTEEHGGVSQDHFDRLLTNQGLESNLGRPASQVGSLTIQTLSGDLACVCVMLQHLDGISQIDLVPYQDRQPLLQNVSFV